MPSGDSGGQLGALAKMPESITALTPPANVRRRGSNVEAEPPTTLTAVATALKMVSAFVSSSLHKEDLGKALESAAEDLYSTVKAGSLPVCPATAASFLLDVHEVSATRDCSLSETSAASTSLPFPTTATDEAERLVESTLRGVLETERYMPRHYVQQICQQLSTSLSDLRASPGGFGAPERSPWQPNLYLRYKAPQVLRLPTKTGDASSPATSQSGKVPLGPTVPQDTHTSSSPAPTISSSPSPLTPHSTDLATPLFPSPDRPPVGRRQTSAHQLRRPPPARSEEYLPKKGPREEDPFDPTDEYRDDDDPGFRIRELWESELIEEINAREQNLPSSVRIPYYAAFIRSDDIVDVEPSPSAAAADVQSDEAFDMSGTANTTPAKSGSTIDGNGLEGGRAISEGATGEGEDLDSSSSVSGYAGEEGRVSEAAVIGEDSSATAARDSDSREARFVEVSSNNILQERRTAEFSNESPDASFALGPSKAPLMVEKPMEGGGIPKDKVWGGGEIESPRRLKSSQTGSPTFGVPSPAQPSPDEVAVAVAADGSAEGDTTSQAFKNIVVTSAELLPPSPSAALVPTVAISTSSPPAVPTSSATSCVLPLDPSLLPASSSTRNALKLPQPTGLGAPGGHTGQSPHQEAGGPSSPTFGTPHAEQQTGGGGSQARSPSSHLFGLPLSGVSCDAPRDQPGALKASIVAGEVKKLDIEPRLPAFGLDGGPSALAVVSPHSALHDDDELVCATVAPPPKTTASTSPSGGPRQPLFDISPVRGGGVYRQQRSPPLEKSSPPFTNETTTANVGQGSSDVGIRSGSECSSSSIRRRCAGVSGSRPDSANKSTASGDRPSDQTEAFASSDRKGSSNNNNLSRSGSDCPVSTPLDRRTAYRSFGSARLSSGLVIDDQYSRLSNTTNMTSTERWHAIYAGGNLEAHRKAKKEKKKQLAGTFCYPEPGDPRFPIRDRGRVYDCFNLKVIFERDKTGFEEYKEFQVKLSSVIAGRYVVESQLGQAAFSKALRCYDRELRMPVCMKVIRNEKDYVDQSLDEIKLLRYINANGDVDELNCLRLLDFFYYKEHLVIVTEILKENLYEFGKRHREKGQPYFTIGRVQKVAYQVLIALQYVHSLRLIHCDLKPENVLMKSEEDCTIKVIDFGSSCFEDDQLSLYVQSRSYRAPEVLLGLPYDQKVDIWSFGCILAELWTGYVLFQNDSVAALLARIVGIIGRLPYYMVFRGLNVGEHFTQDSQLFKVQSKEPVCPKRGKRIRILLPKVSSLKQRLRTNDTLFVEFLTQLLQIDPSKRPTAQEALQHRWLTPGLYTDGL